jgi:hypothetical protein
MGRAALELHVGKRAPLPLPAGSRDNAKRKRPGALAHDATAGVLDHHLETSGVSLRLDCAGDDISGKFKPAGDRSRRDIACAVLRPEQKAGAAEGGTRGTADLDDVVTRDERLARHQSECRRGQ